MGRYRLFQRKSSDLPLNHAPSPAPVTAKHSASIYLSVGFTPRAHTGAVQHLLPCAPSRRCLHSSVSHSTCVCGWEARGRRNAWEHTSACMSPVFGFPLAHAVHYSSPRHRHRLCRFRIYRCRRADPIQDRPLCRDVPRRLHLVSTSSYLLP